MVKFSSNFRLHLLHTTMLTTYSMYMIVGCMPSIDEGEWLYPSRPTRPASDPAIFLHIEISSQQYVFLRGKKSTLAEWLSRYERVVRRSTYNCYYISLCVNTMYTYNDIEYPMLQTAYLNSILDDK